ncbi:winged helix-turn-helix domain-containing protein [Paenibacillus donghaensis]|uniref:GntR family transcriptional regulator n=1 Tax=Paenibacillus donghaensis TaxID=414771 RepID=UPI003183B92C
MAKSARDSGSARSAQGQPLFRQVMKFMLNRIERGEWKAHEKLPSIRLLAEETAVHRLTVFKAYRQLVEEGKLYVREKQAIMSPRKGAIRTEGGDCGGYSRLVFADQCAFGYPADAGRISVLASAD